MRESQKGPSGLAELVERFRPSHAPELVRRVFAAMLIVVAMGIILVSAYASLFTPHEHPIEIPTPAAAHKVAGGSFL